VRGMGVVDIRGWSDQRFHVVGDHGRRGGLGWSVDDMVFLG